MAEEGKKEEVIEDVPDSVVENLKAPIVESNEPAYTQDETVAMSYGWKPKDQWQGKPEDHRSARDFLERGEMIGKMRAQDRELFQMKQALTSVSQQNKKIYENGYRAALAELNSKHKEALEAGDLVAADQLKDNINYTKQQIFAVQQAPDPVSAGPDPGFQDWVAQNPWYTDKVMQNFADGLAVTYVQENLKQGQQVTLAQVRDFVAGTVRQEFAHRFEGKKVQGAPNPDSNGRQQSGDKSKALPTNLSKIKASLSDDERQIMKTMVKAAGMTEAEYLKQYASL